MDDRCRHDDLGYDGAIGTAAATDSVIRRPTAHRTGELFTSAGDGAG